jgi:hypothetical protein
MTYRSFTDQFPSQFPSLDPIQYPGQYTSQYPGQYPLTTYPSPIYYLGSYPFGGVLGGYVGYGPQSGSYTGQMTTPYQVRPTLYF